MGRISTLLSSLEKGRRDDLVAALSRSTLPAWVFRHNVMLIAQLVEPRPLPRPLDKVTIRWGGPEDEAALQTIRRRAGGYARNFETSLCLIGEVDGTPASFNFFETGSWHDSKSNAYRFRLGPGAAWAWGFEVHPRFRLSGVFAKQWVVGQGMLAERGIDRIYGSIQADNPRSVKSHRRLGFRMLCSFEIWRVLGLVWHRVVPEEGGGLEASSGWGSWSGTP